MQDLVKDQKYLEVTGISDLEVSPPYVLFESKVGRDDNRDKTGFRSSREVKTPRKGPFTVWEKEEIKKIPTTKTYLPSIESSI